MIIVSANYHDWQDKKKPWLARDSGEEPSPSQVESEIHVTGVTFHESGIEAGFGCGIVGHAKMISGQVPPVPEHATRIHFNGSTDFYAGQNIRHCWITGVDELWLTKDKEIYGVGITFKK